MALLSRVADRIYWAARYVERAEDSARVLRAYGDVLTDLPTTSTRWSPLVSISGSDVVLPAVIGSDENQVTAFLVSDREHPNSIINTVERSRENLRTCREVVPREAWQTLNDLLIYVRGSAVTSIERRRRERFLTRVIDESRRLDGVLQVSMTRDEAYEMWRLGRYIERAEMTTRVLGVRAASLLSLPPGATDEFAEVQWMGVLRSLGALQSFQRATRGPIDGPAVVRFLLFDHRFPRSVAGCLAEMRMSVLRLPAYATVLGSVEGADRQLRRSRPGSRRRRRARCRDGSRPAGARPAQQRDARTLRAPLTMSTDLAPVERPCRQSHDGDRGSPRSRRRARPTPIACSVQKGPVTSSTTCHCARTAGASRWSPVRGGSTRFRS